MCNINANEVLFSGAHRNLQSDDVTLVSVKVRGNPISTFISNFDCEVVMH